MEQDSFKQYAATVNPQNTSKVHFPVCHNTTNIASNPSSGNNSSSSNKTAPRSFIPLPAEPKTRKLRRAAGKVLTYNTLIRDIEKCGKPFENSQMSSSNSSSEDLNVLMEEVMHKMSDYFSNEFDKLAKFNQLIYMKHIENKKRLRNEILANLSKMTKIQQVQLIYKCLAFLFAFKIYMHIWAFNL